MFGNEVSPQLQFSNGFNLQSQFGPPIDNMSRVLASMTPEQRQQEINSFQSALFGNLTLEGIQSNFHTMLADPTTANSVINSHTPYLGAETAYNDAMQGINEFSQHRSTLNALSAGLQAQGYATIADNTHLGGGQYLGFP